MCEGVAALAGEPELANLQGCNVVASHLDNLHATVGRPLHVGKAKWNIYTFRSRSASSETAKLPRCASSLPGQRKHKRGGKKARAQALRRGLASENLLTDATQLPLEFYDSQPSAQGTANKPVVSPDVLLGDCAYRATPPRVVSSDLQQQMA